MTTSTSTSTSQRTSSSTSESSSTTVPTTVEAIPTTADPSDPEVETHQQTLTALGYWLGEVDGVPGPRTQHAVTAFQKAEGLPRTAALDDATVDRLAVATRPTGRSSSGTVLEIDLARQILLIVESGQVLRVYDVATGATATPTPPGEFRIYHEIDGFRHAPLGTLYRPKYFNGGIAFHGYTSVPTEPASHGCVRLTYAAMDDLWASGHAPIGAVTWVY